jgi:hypothetical protein
MVSQMSLNKANEANYATPTKKDHLKPLNIDKTDDFDKHFKLGSGRLIGIDMHPHPNQDASTTQTLDINIVQNMFGLPKLKVLAAIAENYGFHTKIHYTSAAATQSAKQNRRT